MAMDERLFDTVFPTPVGMNRFCGFKPSDIRSVPHARGDEPPEDDKDEKKPKCSPRPWG